MIGFVGIIGRGALGIMYYEALSKALGSDHVFMLVDDSRYARYKNETIISNQKEIFINYLSQKDAKALDLIIFTVKYPGLLSAIETVRPFVADKTIVMSFLNGVTSEELIKEKLNPQHLLYTTVQGMDATYENLHLSFNKMGYIAFGLGDEDKNTEDLKYVANVFDKSGLKYEISSDITHQLWSKWMLNCGVNQACAYYKVGYGGIQKEGEPRQAMLRAMKEAQAVAEKCGVKLSDEEYLNWVKLIDTLSPDGAPSMEQDRRANRENEVGLFAKTVCDLAARFNLRVPQNEIFFKNL